MAQAETSAGIVVGRTDYRDADLVVRLLTPEHGRVAALARSARASKRRYGGALDVGNRLEAQLRRGRGELWTLESALLVHGRLGVRTDLGRLSLLAYTVEVAGRLARVDYPEPRLFGLLDMAGLLIDGATDAPSTLFRLGFEAKALAFAGLRPALDRCAVCGEDLGPGAVWAMGRGGAAHPRCAPGTPLHAPGPWRAAVERALHTPLRELLDTPVPSGPAWALADELECHLGSALKSRSLLASVYSPSTRPANEK